jgi:TRAP-type transport system periplasmic protein
MKSRKNFTITTFMLVFWVMSGVSFAEEKIKWTMVSPLTPGISYVAMYEDMCKNIEKRSNGEMQINFLTFGQHPYKGADIPKAVRDNLIQIGNTADIYISSLVPSISIMSLPFLYNNLDQAKKVYKEMLPGHLNPLMNEKFNASILTGFLISGSAIHADIPLTSLDSLKGRKIRVFNKDTGDMISMLGGTPVSIAFGELYTALQRGTINGCLTGMIGAKAAKVYEVVDNCTWWNWAFPYEFTMVNNNALNDLPTNLQKIVLEESAKTSLKIQAHQDRVPAEILVDAIETYGISAHGLTKDARKQFQEKTKEITQEWLKRSGESGKRAYEIYERVSKK